MNDPTPPSAIRDLQREATLLFADLRGFTDLTSSLVTDPLFCELLSHVMDCLTDAILHHDGFIIDYYGDGLMAMWNAPADQPRHAELACRAGLRIIDTLPNVAAEWTRLIDSNLQIGIGIHTGTVLVGNAGSTQRVKFGARGPNVHLARRVEAATKELRLPLLATRTTAEALSSSFAAHRVCRARMPGVHQPVDLYAVSLRYDEATRMRAWQSYGQSLHYFEQGRFQDAADTLAKLDASATEVPSSFLAERVRQELGRDLRRRSTDPVSNFSSGIIAITAK